MEITNRTVLVTGGGSGIGFEIARALSQKGNKVIIAGRNEARLKNAAAQLKNVSIIACDITNGEDVKKLVQQVKDEFGGLDLLINNAGQANTYKLSADADAFSKASEEISVNYLSLIRLTESLLPILKKQKEAAIVNVSSILAFAPVSAVSTYSASKAAVHSYTQALRHTLSKDSSVKVFELMPPLVNTELSQSIGGANGIEPAQVAEELIKGIEANAYEIHVGMTADFHKLFLSSPSNAFNMLNN